MAHRADRAEIERIVSLYARELEKRYSISGIYLYGSYARGKADQDSDI
jgi:predicted nucleotidyltransferase